MLILCLTCIGWSFLPYLQYKTQPITSIIISQKLKIKRFCLEPVKVNLRYLIKFKIVLNHSDKFQMKCTLCIFSSILTSVFFLLKPKLIHKSVLSLPGFDCSRVGVELGHVVGTFIWVWGDVCENLCCCYGKLW